MEYQDLIDFLGVAERLKCTTRHAYTSSGRRESVAEHSFRAAVMAWLLRDTFPELDMERVLAMCLFHDFGEAFTGDIPVFEKTAADENVEDDAVSAMLRALPAEISHRLAPLFQEMRDMQTPEAQLYKAIDKIEAVIQHDEGDISTWLPLEYDLQLRHGVAECGRFPYMKGLRARVDEITREKIAREGGAVALDSDAE